MSFGYPPVHRGDVVDDYFGKQVGDPYRWLEDPDSKETKMFITEQNKITLPYIQSYEHRETIKESLTSIWDYPKHGEPSLHGDKYFQFRNTGLQNQNVLMILNRLHGAPRVFLDPNKFSNDGTVSLTGIAFSEDGSVLAYGTSASGSDWIKIKFRDTKTGFDYGETLTNIKFTPMTWMHDNIGFFYGGYLNEGVKAVGSSTDMNQNQKLYYHMVGTEQTRDIPVVHFDDPELRIGATVSHCGNYLVITPIKGCKGNMLYYARLSVPVSKELRIHPLYKGSDYDFEYITNEETIFFFRTNKDAPNYKIITIDIRYPEELKWTTLIYEHPRHVMDWVKVINHNRLILCYLQDCKHIMSIHNLRTGELLMYLPVPLGTVTNIVGKKKSQEFFYGVSSFLIPHITYRVGFPPNGDVNISLFYETKVRSFNFENFEAKQVFYESKDGTKIPMFIISRTGQELDGNRPCILYGYGGFNVNLTPFFHVSRLVFVKHFNGVYAIANIRGGGEYGDNWHNAGRFHLKQNCFDDFQYAAKFLIENKYTKPELLTIQGGSNGGLLVTACINQAPELFGAAICQVGVLDMLRYHKFTIGYAWKSDYGFSDDEDQFNYLFAYSPLHNIKAREGKQYPATLLLTADSDDRVVPSHSFKYISELQYQIGSLPQQKNPLMIRIENQAGHGAGKPTIKVIDEITDILAFIAKTMDLKFYR